MKVLAIIAGLTLAVPAHAATVSAGYSVRPGSIDLSVRQGHFEAEFINEGKQPGGIKNVNRVVDIDVVMPIQIMDNVSIFAKAGVTDSTLSYNGSGDGYHSHSFFTGQNVGIGVNWQITSSWGFSAQTVWLRYQQSDKPAYESFVYSSALLEYTIP